MIFQADHRLRISILVFDYILLKYFYFIKKKIHFSLDKSLNFCVNRLKMIRNLILHILLSSKFISSIRKAQAASLIIIDFH